MSIMGRRVPRTAVVLLGLAMFVAALMPVVSESPSREIVLVAKGMAFHVNGNSTPNPTIELVAGERVRIVLRNEDQGMVHDLVAPRLPISFELLNWREERDVTLVVPDLPGTYEYVCQPHSLMMRGRIRVVRR